MKYKYLWAAFIPVSVMMIAVKIFQCFFATDDGIFGISNDLIGYVAIALGVFLLILTYILILFERKKAKVYRVDENLSAGVTSLLFSLGIFLSGFSVAYDMVKTHTLSIINLVDFALALLGGFGMIVFAKTHFTGIKPSKVATYLTLAPSLWACFKVVSIFLNYQIVAITSIDTSGLIFYMLTALLLFNVAVMVSVLDTKNAIKPVFTFGFSTCALSFLYLISLIAGFINGKSDMDLQLISQIVLVLGASSYILTLLFEITTKAKNSDQYEILDSDEKIQKALEEVDKIEEEERAKNLEIDHKNGNYYITSANEDDNDVEEIPGTYGGYIGKAFSEANSLVFDENDADLNKEFNPQNTIDKVDQLLFEISTGETDADLSQMQQEKE